MTKATLHAAKGDVVIKLFDDHTTKTVKNYIDLAKNDFYDGTVLHRLISGFVMQGGGIQGTGTGGLGYKFNTKLHESVFMKSKQPRLVQEIDQLRRSRQILSLSLSKSMKLKNPLATNLIVVISGFLIVATCAQTIT